MKILHITPTFFSDSSIIGGGERYVDELARFMAKNADVRVLSFSKKTKNQSVSNPRYVFAPGFLSFEFLRWILWADIIHCHQCYRLETDVAIILGRLLAKKVFITDLGGYGRYSLAYHMPLYHGVHGILAISHFAKDIWLKNHGYLAHKTHVIGSGVDLSRFRPKPAAASQSGAFLFVGRLMPHKGIDYLIDAITPDMTLDIVGRVYAPDYYKLLLEKASGKNIRFHTQCGDEELLSLYQHALAGIQPSVYTTCYGVQTSAPELFCFSALEIQACGHPVIVTEAGGLPENIKSGETGFLVPPNSAEAIREKLMFFLSNPDLTIKMGLAARKRAEDFFSWEPVVARCMDYYRTCKA